jgi:hypothetical protein
MRGRVTHENQVTWRTLNQEKAGVNEVQLGAAMLALYVGLELSVGNWGPPGPA